jgi:hypothetical protein
MGEHALKVFRREQRLSLRRCYPIGVSGVNLSHRNRKKPSLDTIQKLVTFAEGALSADSFLVQICIRTLEA